MQFKSLVRQLQANALEMWAMVSLFVGLPVVLSLYLDYRAGLGFFFIASVVVALIGLRKA